MSGTSVFVANSVKPLFKEILFLVEHVQRLGEAVHRVEGLVKSLEKKLGFGGSQAYEHEKYFCGKCKITHSFGRDHERHKRFRRTKTWEDIPALDPASLR